MVSLNPCLLTLAPDRLSELGESGTKLYTKLFNIECALQKFELPTWCANPRFKREWRLLKDRFDKCEPQLSIISDQTALNQISNFKSKLAFHNQLVSVEGAVVKLNPIQSAVSSDQLQALGRDFSSILDSLYKTINILTTRANQLIDNETIKNWSALDNQNATILRNEIFGLISSIEQRMVSFRSKVQTLNDDVVLKTPLLAEIEKIEKSKSDAIILFSKMEKDFTDDDLIVFMEHFLRLLKINDINKLLQIILDLRDGIDLDKIEWQDEPTDPKIKKFTCASLGIVLTLAINRNIQNDNYPEFRELIKSYSEKQQELRSILAATANRFDREGTEDACKAAANKLLNGKDDLASSIIEFSKTVHTLYFSQDDVSIENRESESPKPPKSAALKRSPSNASNTPPPPLPPRKTSSPQGESSAPVRNPSNGNLQSLTVTAEDEAKGLGSSTPSMLTKRAPTPPPMHLRKITFSSIPTVTAIKEESGKPPIRPSRQISAEKRKSHERLFKQGLHRAHLQVKFVEKDDSKEKSAKSLEAESQRTPPLPPHVRKNSQFQPISLADSNGSKKDAELSASASQKPPLPPVRRKATQEAVPVSKVNSTAPVLARIGDDVALLLDRNLSHAKNPVEGKQFYEKTRSGTPVKGRISPSLNKK